MKNGFTSQFCELELKEEKADQIRQRSLREKINEFHDKNTYRTDAFFGRSEEPEPSYDYRALLKSLQKWAEQNIIFDAGVEQSLIQTMQSLFPSADAYQGKHRNGINWGALKPKTIKNIQVSDKTLRALEHIIYLLAQNDNGSGISLRHKIDIVTSLAQEMATCKDKTVLERIVTDHLTTLINIKNNVYFFLKEALLVECAKRFSKTVSGADANIYFTDELIDKVGREFKCRSRKNPFSQGLQYTTYIGDFKNYLEHNLKPQELVASLVSKAITDIAGLKLQKYKWWSTPSDDEVKKSDTLYLNAESYYSEANSSHMVTAIQYKICSPAGKIENRKIYASTFKLEIRESDISSGKHISKILEKTSEWGHTGRSTEDLKQFEHRLNVFGEDKEYNHNNIFNFDAATGIYSVKRTSDAKVDNGVWYALKRTFYRRMIAAKVITADCIQNLNINGQPIVFFRLEPELSQVPIHQIPKTKIQNMVDFLKCDEKADAETKKHTIKFNETLLNTLDNLYDIKNYLEFLDTHKIPYDSAKWQCLKFNFCDLVSYTQQQWDNLLKQLTQFCKSYSVQKFLNLIIASPYPDADRWKPLLIKQILGKKEIFQVNLEEPVPDAKQTLLEKCIAIEQFELGGLLMAHGAVATESCLNTLVEKIEASGDTSRLAYFSKLFPIMQEELVKKFVLKNLYGPLWKKDTEKAVRTMRETLKIHQEGKNEGGIRRIVEALREQKALPNKVALSYFLHELPPQLKADYLRKASTTAIQNKQISDLKNLLSATSFQESAGILLAFNDLALQLRYAEKAMHLLLGSSMFEDLLLHLVRKPEIFNINFEDESTPPENFLVKAYRSENYSTVHRLLEYKADYVSCRKALLAVLVSKPFSQKRFEQSLQFFPDIWEDIITASHQQIISQEPLKRADLVDLFNTLKRIDEHLINPRILKQRYELTLSVLLEAKFEENKLIDFYQKCRINIIDTSKEPGLLPTACALKYFNLIKQLRDSGAFEKETVNYSITKMYKDETDPKERKKMIHFFGEEIRVSLKDSIIGFLNRWQEGQEKNLENTSTALKKGLDVYSEFKGEDIIKALSEQKSIPSRHALQILHQYYPEPMTQYLTALLPRVIREGQGFHLFPVFEMALGAKIEDIILSEKPAASATHWLEKAFQHILQQDDQSATDLASFQKYLPRFRAKGIFDINYKEDGQDPFAVKAVRRQDFYMAKSLLDAKPALSGNEAELFQTYINDACFQLLNDTLTEQARASLLKNFPREVIHAISVETREIKSPQNLFAVFSTIHLEEQEEEKYRPDISRCIGKTLTTIFTKTSGLSLIPKLSVLYQDAMGDCIRNASVNLINGFLTKWPSSQKSPIQQLFIEGEYPLVKAILAAAKKHSAGKFIEQILHQLLDCLDEPGATNLREEMIDIFQIILFDKPKADDPLINAGFDINYVDKTSAGKETFLIKTAKLELIPLTRLLLINKADSKQTDADSKPYSYYTEYSLTKHKFLEKHSDNFREWKRTTADECKQLNDKMQEVKDDYTPLEIGKLLAQVNCLKDAIEQYGCKEDTSFSKEARKILTGYITQLNSHITHLNQQLERLNKKKSALFTDGLLSTPGVALLPLPDSKNNGASTTKKPDSASSSTTTTPAHPNGQSLYPTLPGADEDWEVISLN